MLLLLLLCISTLFTIRPRENFTIQVPQDLIVKMTSYKVLSGIIFGHIKYSRPINELETFNEGYNKEYTI